MRFRKTASSGNPLGGADQRGLRLDAIRLGAGLALDADRFEDFRDLIDPFLRQQRSRQTEPGGLVVRFLRQDLTILRLRLRGGGGLGGRGLLHGGIGGRGDLIEELPQGGLRQQSLELVDQLAVEDHLHRRDGCDAEIGRKFLLLIDVDLGEEDFPLPLINEAFQQGTQRPAGSASGRPEIDQYGPLARGFDHVGLERLGSHVTNIGRGSSHGSIRRRFL